MSIETASSSKPMVANDEVVATSTINVAISHETSNNDEPILSDNFKYYKKKSLVSVSLYSNRIEFSGSKPPLKQTVSLANVIGTKIGKGHTKSDQNAYLTIYIYTNQTNINNNNNNSKISRRKRIVLELECSKFGSNFDENLQYVNTWHLKIDDLLRQEIFHRFLKTNQDLTKITSDDYKTRLSKPFLILVNPKSGAGKAKNLYHEHILPVMAEANLNNTVVFTQHANHAREYVKSIKLDDWRGIVVVSGDGLIYEVINGLMDRTDWHQAIKIPIGQIPGGSANAVVCCISYLTNEAFKGLSLESFAKNASFNLVKSIQTPLDLIFYEQANRKLVTSCLAFEWAIIADVDLESEKYRYLGGMRFLVGALKRILKLRIYRGRLSFLLSDSSQTYKPKSTNINVTQYNQINKDDNNNENEPNKNTQSEHLVENIKFKYLRPLNEKVPNNWVTIEDNFVLFLVVYLPLIAPDFLAAKESKFNDGNMHLVFIKEGITKTELLNLFTLTEEGDHLNHPLVEYVKIKAFRLEPLPLNNSNNGNNNREGIMMVDGEQVPCEPIQAEIIPSMANILANVKLDN